MTLEHDAYCTHVRTAEDCACSTGGQCEAARALLWLADVADRKFVGAGVGR